MINISMIYSINGIFYDLKFKNGNSLQNCKFEHDDIFYHHDFTNTKLYDFLEEVHWDHIRNNKNVKLLHVNCGETFREDSVLQIQQVVNSRKIDPSQIYILFFRNLVILK